MVSVGKDKVFILDTTLRDGEQAPGAAMTIKQKIEIAEALDNMGVDIIEAGFAAASEGDYRCIQQISRQVKNAVVCSMARAKSSDLEAAGLAIKDAVTPRIHTFMSTSDLHLQHQFQMTRDEALLSIDSSVRFARKFCNDIEWTAMDATRSDLAFLIKAIRTAIKAGAAIINIPDTVGYTTPEEYQTLITNLKKQITELSEVILSTHCHNDLGLAVANSLTALKAGARQVECTINGIGERAGNAALEEVVMAIKTRPDQFPFDIAIDTTHIAGVSQLVARASGFSVQKNKAIVGENAFVHASGIHQDGMLKNSKTYEIISPESVGVYPLKLYISKHSGRTALLDKISSLGLEVDESRFEALFKKFKELGDCQKQISDNDIIALIKGK